MRALVQFVHNNELVSWYGDIDKIVERELSAAVPSASDAFSPAQRAVLRSHVALRCNLHKWQHHSSCFSKGDGCRYRVPHAPVEKTGFGDGRLILQRSAGNEYLTPFIAVLLDVLRCNHDLRVLLSDDGVDAVFYVVK